MRLTLLCLGLLFTAGASAAQNIESCRRHLAAGRGGMVAEAPKPAAPRTAKVFVAGHGAVPLAAFSALRQAGDGREMCQAARPLCDHNPEGPTCQQARQKCAKVGPDMCDVAEQALRSDPGGDTAKVAKALWPS